MPDASDVNILQWLDEEIQLIKTEAIRDMVKSRLEQFPPGWGLRKAGSKRHPPFAKFPFGQVLHTKMTVRIAHSLAVECFCVSSDMIDSIVAAALLHDAWKFNPKGTLSLEDSSHADWMTQHGRRYAKTISSEFPDIAEGIESHMGDCDGVGDFMDSLPRLIVRLADFMSSREFISGTLLTQERS